MELHGKTILITRASSQSEKLRRGLEQAGARVLECPAIEILPVEDWTEVDRVVSNLDSYDWVIFTSANAVEFFMRRVMAQGVTCAVPIVTVGTATGGKLKEWNLKPTLVPHNFRAEGILEVFPEDLSGDRILLPRAETARELLPEELRGRGAIVDVITVYRTIKSSAGLNDLRATLAEEKIDVITFSSPSAIRYFAEALGEEMPATVQTIPIAVIGPNAADTAVHFGLKPSIQPERATIEDLIGAIRTYFRQI
jgi:uroporphyrinogen III methyltransferase / synthase